MNKLGFVIIMSCFLIISCGDTATQDPAEKSLETTRTQEQSTQEEKEVSIESIQLIATIDELRVRDEAGLKGKEVARLAAGNTMTYLNEMSNFTTQIKLRKVQYDDPWLKVKTTDGKEGWVYAGAVKFNMDKSGKALTDKIITKRLIQFFGAENQTAIERYQTLANSVKTESDVAAFYQQGVKVQENLNKILSEKMSDYDGADFPDLFWVDESLPALETSIVAEGTSYYLFFNYKILNELAQKTTGTADDDFAYVQMMANSLDSTEYFFKSWYLQTWDYGGYSLLGKGVHTKMLDAIESNLKKSNLFQAQYQTIKNELMQDITEGEEYGYPKATVLAEVDKIIGKNYTCLSDDDKIGLKTRRTIFNTPKKNKLTMNMRDGY